MATRTRNLEKTEWLAYFGVLSETIGAANVTIIVEGLDLGVQPAAQHVPLQSITYLREDDALCVIAEGVEHRIEAPTRIDVLEDAQGRLLSARICESAGHEQIIEIEPVAQLGAP